MSSIKYKVCCESLMCEKSCGIGIVLILLGKFLRYRCRFGMVFEALGVVLGLFLELWVSFWNPKIYFFNSNKHFVAFWNQRTNKSRSTQSSYYIFEHFGQMLDPFDSPLGCRK